MSQCRSCKYFAPSIPESRNHPCVDDDECEYISGNITTQSTDDAAEAIGSVLEKLLFLAAENGRCPMFVAKYPGRS